MASKVYFITGMHRSGTSHLAGRLEALGLVFPGDLLPATADNPDGYREARELVRLNNEILDAAGQSWKSITPLTPDVMSGLCAAFEGKAADCLARLQAQAGGRDFAVKDPRLCRLLPVWIAAAASAGLEVRLVASLREPSEIAASLFHRLRDPKSSPAAIDVPGQSLLLTLRYLLDLEVQSRALPRRFVAYREIKGLARLEDLFAGAAGGAEPGRGAISFDAWGDAARAVSALLASPELASRQDQLDEIRSRFDDDAHDLAAVSGSGNALSFAAAAAKLQTKSSGPTRPRRRVIAFVSGAPESRGHIYRIENRIAALRGGEAGVIRVDPEKASPEDVAGCADLIVVFRKEMDTWLERLLQRARRSGAATVFDIDDLVFDPGMMRPEIFGYLEGKTEAFMADWQAKAARWAEAAEAADMCWATTPPLAQHMQRLNPNVRVLKNGLSDFHGRMARRLDTVTKSKPEGRIVLGYASGTPTHDRDFKQVAGPVAELLARFPHLLLRITGELSAQALAPLSAVSGQVEHRPLVGFYDVPLELAGADINLAPLEAGNPFCECKSELKIFESGALGVPTVASPTAPYRAALVEGESGFTANTPEDWLETLSLLVRDTQLRQRLGTGARARAQAMFGPDQQRLDFLDRIGELERLREGAPS